MYIYFRSTHDAFPSGYNLSILIPWIFNHDFNNYASWHHKQGVYLSFTLLSWRFHYFWQNELLIKKIKRYKIPLWFIWPVISHKRCYLTKWSVSTLGLFYVLLVSDHGRYIGVMMTSSNGNIFRVTGHLCGEFTGLRWIPHTKASDAELWCFLWSAPEQTLE